MCPFSSTVCLDEGNNTMLLYAMLLKTIKMHMNDKKKKMSQYLYSTGLIVFACWSHPLRVFTYFISAPSSSLPWCTTSLAGLSATVWYRPRWCGTLKVTVRKINRSFRYLLGLEGRALMDSYLPGFLQLSIRGHSVHSTETLLSSIFSRNIAAASLSCELSESLVYIIMLIHV